MEMNILLHVQAKIKELKTQIVLTVNGMNQKQCNLAVKVIQKSISMTINV
jgi:uncharacterized protein (DUF2141 family)